jgi:hypothetical protein
MEGKDLQAKILAGPTEQPVPFPGYSYAYPSSQTPYNPAFRPVALPVIRGDTVGGTF